MKESKGYVRFLKNQYSIYMIIDVFLNGCTFLLYLYMSWMFSQEVYGKLNALLSFLALTYVLGVSYQMYVTKMVSSNERHFGKIVASAKRLVKVLIIPFLLVTPLLSYFLQATLLTVIMVGLITGISIFLCMERGIIQGQERFIHLSISLCIDIGIKVLVIVPVLLVTSSIPLVLLATLIGHIGAYIFCRVINQPYYELEVDYESTSLRKVYYSIWSIFTAQFFFYFFTSIDMVVVNHYLSEKSGIYAITIKLGQLYLMFGTALVFLWFSKIVRKRNDSATFKKIAYQCLVAVLSLGCILAFLYHVILSKWIPLFFPAEYIEVQKYLGFSSFNYTFLLISIILTYFCIAYDNKGYIKIFSLGAIVYCVLTTFFHENLMSVMFVQLFTYLIMAILLLYNFSNSSRREGEWQ